MNKHKSIPSISFGRVLKVESIELVNRSYLTFINKIDKERLICKMLIKSQHKYPESLKKYALL